MQPIYRTLEQEVALGAFYSDRETETFLLGTPFSFTNGVADARSRVRAVRLTADWVYRSEAQVLSARVLFKQGLDLPGVTVNPNLADGLFFTRFLQAQWVRRLSNAGNQIVFRYDRQFSNGKLLPSDKFALGGVDSVRGYRENRLVKDQGWFASLEYRHPVARWVPGFLSTRNEDGVVQLVAFTDRGRAYDDQELPTSFPDRLSSVGVGVRWDLTPGIYMRFYYAKALEKITVPDADPQDRGLHFIDQREQDRSEKLKMKPQSILLAALLAFALNAHAADSQPRALLEKAEAVQRLGHRNQALEYLEQARVRAESGRRCCAHRRGPRRAR